MCAERRRCDDPHCPLCRATDTPAVAGPPPDLQQAIHAPVDDWDDAAPPRPLHERVPWRIGVLDKDLLNDPDAIVDNASWIAGWYVHDAAALLEQLQAAQAENQQLREVLERSTTIHAADRDGRCTFCTGFPDHAHCWYCGIREPSHLNDCIVYAALEHRAALWQVDPPAHPENVGDHICGCSFSTLPGKELVCAEDLGHRGQHRADGVTWPRLFPDHAALGQVDQ